MVELLEKEKRAIYLHEFFRGLREMQGGGQARNLRGGFLQVFRSQQLFRGHFVAKQKARPVVWGCSLIPEVPTLEGRCAVLTPRSPEQEDSGGIVRRRSSVFRIQTRRGNSSLL